MPPPPPPPPQPCAFSPGEFCGPPVVRPGRTAASGGRARTPRGWRMRGGKSAPLVAPAPGDHRGRRSAPPPQPPRTGPGAGRATLESPCCMSVRAASCPAIASLFHAPNLPPPRPLGPSARACPAPRRFPVRPELGSRARRPSLCPILDLPTGALAGRQPRCPLHAMLTTVVGAGGISPSHRRGHLWVWARVLSSPALPAPTGLRQRIGRWSGLLHDRAARAPPAL